VTSSAFAVFGEESKSSAGYAQAFRQFGPGTWKLALHRERELPAADVAADARGRDQEYRAVDRDGLLASEPAAAAHHDRGHRQDRRREVRDHGRLLGPPSFEACFVPKLDAATREAFTLVLLDSVTSTYQPYFRIDNVAAATVKLLVETPDQRDVRMEGSRSHADRRREAESAGGRSIA
jgi:hypothetical protein